MGVCYHVQLSRCFFQARISLNTTQGQSDLQIYNGKLLGKPKRKFASNTPQITPAGTVFQCGYQREKG
jgi:hypothetical protein